ncbi:cytochrome P450 [Mycobacterium sp. CVI_P3]|uniref:Cytochrome P450 n=1 Tax=Mycobacterium pinniadriaticum TaxID=2994102 RepID=A0ABT3SN95_9MYCO|nr:cytochrome P450 [Mycobacterium pinniadriaticum]MCX2934571.1 cytochrome P450 [Mycobacterium pinniadriaticum]MCX2940994.1 cytochrome P450 [Mycobacterium pinniadriaticum]
MTEFKTMEFLSDPALIVDPYDYIAQRRAECPVSIDPGQGGMMAVLGYDATMAVYKDTEGFSACNAVAGPFAPLPFTPEGDDISDQIVAHRKDMAFGDFMAVLDPPQHGRARGLLSRLLTPRRLKENEEFMWAFADKQLDTIVRSGSCEFLGQYAQPFALLVIADLLGVPQEDHGAFLGQMATTHNNMAETQGVPQNPLQFLEDRFTAYVEDRRCEPREDALTVLAHAKYPDESIPEVIDVVRLATFLFAAGQETTTKLLTFAMQILGENPDLQTQLRGDLSLIPNFLEETLRLESPIKSHFRLAAKSTTIDGVPAKAGTTMMLMPGAANRDPNKFDNPDEFRLDRHNVREHLTFGRGVHTCPGAAMARMEGVVSLERILSRMGDIRIAEAHHGPASARRYTYDPSFMMRGLTDLHLEFTPIDS